MYIRVYVYFKSHPSLFQNVTGFIIWKALKSTISALNFMPDGKKGLTTGFVLRQERFQTEG